MTLKRSIPASKNRKRVVVGCLLALAMAAGFFTTVPSLAQGGDKYKVRLAPAPALGIPAANVVGIGAATATLSGRKLTITGSFEKLASPATTAKLGLGLVTGARGDPIFDLTVAKAAQSNPAGTSGTIAGSFDLTPVQVDALKKGKLYIQIHSQGAPNGHLLGWLLK